MRIQNASVLECHGLNQGASNAHHDGTFDLVLQLERIVDCSTFEGLHHAHNLYLLRRGIDVDLHAARDVAALLEAGGHAEALCRARFGPAPSEALGRGFDHRAQARIARILQTEGERLHADRRSKFVHVGLSREVVGSRRESAIRSLSQRRFGGVVLALLARNVVRALEAGAAGVVVVKLPGDDRAVLAGAAADFDDAAGPEVGPGEFLFARPRHFHRLARGSGEASGFDGRFAGVLAAVAGAGVGNDVAHIRRGDR